MGIQSYIATGNVRSQFRVREGLLSCKSEVTYKWKNSETQTVSLSGKVQKTSKGALSKYTAQASLISAQSPDNNIDFTWETQKSRGYCENTGKVMLGKSSWEGKALYKKQFGRGAQDIHFKLSLQAPKSSIDYNAEFQHQKTESGITTKFSTRTDSETELRAQMEYLSKKEKLMQKNLNFEMTWPEHQYSLQSSLKEIRSGEFEGEVTILPNGGTEKKASLSYRNGSSKVKLEHSLEFRARGFLNVPVSGSASLSASDKLSHLGAQLEIEGKEKYSGRWSGNLDYNSSRKNVNKFEGKVALNEKKYSGEVTFRQTKTGDRTAVLDVKMHGGRRIYSEMKVCHPY